MGTEVVIFPLLDGMGTDGITRPRWTCLLGMSIGSLSQHLQRTTTLKTAARCIRSPCSRRQVLSLFLLPENVVPVVLVGFGYCLLTLAHTLFFLV